MSKNESLLEPPKGKLQKADVEALTTLIQQYDQALETNAEKIASYEKTKEDYLQLRKKLTMLPNKLEYNAVLPLGTRALCPGKIVHTNEITVKLSDTWYIETSAKTAAEIVTHRLKKCDDMLASLVKEEELYRSWREEANRQKSEALHEGTIEIQEEYDDQKEKQWRLKHKENLRKYHQNLAKERKQKAEEASKENDIWSRMDELEMEEELEEAGISLDSLKIDDDESATTNEVDAVIEENDNKNVKTPDPEANQSVSKKSKKVTFSSENVIHTLIPDEKSHPLTPYIHPNRRKTMNLANNSKEPSGSATSSSSQSVQVCEPLVIHFKHSEPDDPTSIESNSEECDNQSQMVRTPGDILKFFGGKGGTTFQTGGKPKSILKSRRQSWPNDTNVPAEDNNITYNHVLTKQSSITSTSTSTKPVPNINSNKRVATVDKVNDSESEESVKDTVIERGSGSTSMNSNNEPSTNDQDNADAKKPVSLFRQSRQNK